MEWSETSDSLSAEEMNPGPPVGGGVAALLCLVGAMTARRKRRLEIVPDGWVARIAGMRPRTLMTADEFERAVPEVNLVGPQTAGR